MKLGWPVVLILEYGQLVEKTKDIFQVLQLLFFEERKSVCFRGAFQGIKRILLYFRRNLGKR